MRSEEWLESKAVTGSRTMTTTSGPYSRMSGVAGEGSSTAWVHLHSTICTEWSQECMVIKHSGHSTPSVKAPKTIHRCILKTSVNTKAQVRLRRSMICSIPVIAGPY